MKKLKILMLAALLICITGILQSAKAQSTFVVELYSSSSPAIIGQGDNLGNFTPGGSGFDPNHPGPDYYGANLGQIVNLRDYLRTPPNAAGGSLNDRAKSARISGKKGMVLTFFNNADLDYSGGSCIVVFKKDVTGYNLNGFEGTYEDEWVKVNYWSEGQSLNGNVSCIEVYQQ